MPLLGMGGETEKGTALPILPWWNAVAINDVPAQSDFYSTANGRLLNDLLRSARDADKVALLLKVWRQRLSYRLVRSAEESKIALSSAASVETALPFIQDDLATAIAQQGLEAALDQPLTRIMEQVRLALDSSQTTPDVIYLTGGSARSPLIKKALAAQLPGIPLAGGDDFGSVTAGLARWAQVVSASPRLALPRSRSVLILALQITLEYSWSPTQNGLFVRTGLSTLPASGGVLSIP